MDKTQHTPGPWQAFDTHTGAISINKTAAVPIATVGGAGWHIGEDVARANAALITAAPDMLAALVELFEQAQSVQAYIPTHSHKPLMELQAALVKARDAINAATGKVGT